MNLTAAQIRGYLRQLLHGQQKAIAGALLLLFVVSVFDGLSLASILPLLVVMLDAVAADQLVGGVGHKLLRLFEYVHVSPTVPSVSLLILSVFLFKAALRLASRWYIIALQNRYEDRVLQQLFRSTLEADIGFHYRTSQGAFVHAFSDEANQSALLLVSISEIVVSVFTVIAYGVLLVAMSAPLSLIAVIGSVMLLAPLRFIPQAAYRYGDQCVDRRHTLLSFLIEVKTGVKFVKSLGSQLTMIEQRFAELITQLSQVRFKKEFFANSLIIWGEPLGIFVVLLILGLGSSVFHVAVAELLLFLFIYIRLIPVLNTLFVRWGEFLIRLPSLHRVQEYIRTAGAHRERATGSQKTRGSIAIAFEDVSFGYGAAPVLQHVTFSVSAGELAFIVGPSGVGKSTVLDLIMGLHRPHHGRILVNGIPLMELDLDDWRRQISYIPQEGFLFSETILRNLCLRLGREDAEQARVAARAVGAHPFIMERSGNYAAMLGERGVNLSGGQRQRVAMARALIPLPQLLIFDEPTNALDAVSEEEIMQCIVGLRGRVTILIVTHNMAMVRDADKVIHVRTDEGTTSATSS